MKTLKRSTFLLMDNQAEGNSSLAVMGECSSAGNTTIKKTEGSTMNIRTTLITSSLIAASLVSGAAQATLIDRGGGLIYDTDLNLTWLADANYALTSGYDANGRMTWAEATTWAANLSYGGYNDWRLPTTTDTGASGCNYAFSGTDCGFNVDPASSEMAHLFFTELGNLSAYTTSGTLVGGSSGVNWGLVNKGPFTNFQFYDYWSGTEYAPRTDLAWFFSTSHGYQNYNFKTTDLYALAVRPGDVAAVPEPATLLLLGFGLAGLGWVQRRISV